MVSATLPEAAPRDDEPSSPREAVRLLVLEDDPNVLMPLADLLTANGYEVITATNGKDGINLAKEHQPDLIVSDIMMPQIDGYGVLAALQEDPETAIIPFIFLTARTKKEDMRAGMGLGADDYITKPFEAKDLLASIKARLKKHQSIGSGATVVAGNPEYDQIYIKDGDACWLVEHERIRLIESEDSYIRVFFDNDKPLLNRTLNFMEERLPVKYFFRANRKQIINLKWVKSVQPWFSGGLLVMLKDGTKVQMSRRATQTFKSRLGI